MAGIYYIMLQIKSDGKLKYDSTRYQTNGTRPGRRDVLDERKKCMTNYDKIFYGGIKKIVIRGMLHSVSTFYCTKIIRNDTSTLPSCRTPDTVA